MPPYLIANPQAGGGKGYKIFKKACRLLEASSWDFVPRLTNKPGEATKLAIEALNMGAELVIACGGDGTINEVVNGLKDNQARLGIIPAGRGNDLARSLGIPLEIELACAILQQGHTRRIDTIYSGGRLFCVVAVLGLAARVTELSNQEFKSTGVMPYLLPIKQALREHSPLKLKMEYDTGSYNGEITLLAIGNTRYCGGGMKLTPTAIPDDGVMDVCVVERISKLKILTALPSLFSGKLLDKPFVKHFRTNSLKIFSPKLSPILADGDFFKKVPAEFKINPSSLRVIVGN